MSQNRTTNIAATNDEAAIAGVKWMGWGFTLISIVSSAYFMATSLEVSKYGWAGYIGVCVLAVGFAVLLDFCGVALALTIGMRNVAYMFVEPDRLRTTIKVVSCIFLTIGFSALFFSAYTSYMGSSVAGTYLAGKFDPQQDLGHLDGQRAAKEDALSPYRSKIEDLKAEMDQEIKMTVPATFIEGAKAGKRYHQTMYDSLSRPIRKKYEKKIEEAEKTLANWEAKEDSTFGRAAAVVGKNMERNLQVHEMKSEAMHNIFRYAGSVSIVLAFLCNLIMALLEVAANTTPRKRASSSTAALSSALSGSGNDPKKPSGGGGGNGGGAQPLTPSQRGQNHLQHSQGGVPLEYR